MQRRRPRPATNGQGLPARPGRLDRDGGRGVGRHERHHGPELHLHARPARGGLGEVDVVDRPGFHGDRG